MDQALVVDLLTTFDYRKARARDGVRHRMRGVTTRDGCIEIFLPVDR